MELLKELIDIISRHSAHALQEILPKESRERKLVDAVLSGAAQTDQEGIIVTYGHPGKEKEYLLLKKNLRGLLLECVFNAEGLDQEERGKFGSREKKELMVAEKLLNQNSYHNAEKIILDVKAYAEKFQILDLQITCAKHLRTIYTLKGNPKEVELHNVVLKKLSQFHQYEQAAIGFNNLLESKTRHSIGKYRDIAIEAKHYVFQIREWLKEFASPTLRLYQYKIELIIYYHVNDLKEWGFTLNMLNELMSKNSFLKTESNLLYLNMEWAKYMRCVANISEAMQYVTFCLDHSDYTSLNKFEAQALHFDLKIKEKKYPQAGEILKKIKEQPQFFLLELAAQEAWLLQEAYLFFIFSTLDQETNIKKYTPSFINDFSVFTFINSFKVIVKDKKGYNVMLIIIKEALTEYKTPADSDNRANALLLYFQNHMKDSCEERSKNFVKKLAKAIKSDVPELSKRASENSGAKAQNYDAAELIPFETLYDLICIAAR